MHHLDHCRPTSFAMRNANWGFNYALPQETTERKTEWGRERKVRGRERGMRYQILCSVKKMSHILKTRVGVLAVRSITDWADSRANSIGFIVLWQGTLCRPNFLDIRDTNRWQEYHYAWLLVYYHVILVLYISIFSKPIYSGCLIEVKLHFFCKRGQISWTAHQFHKLSMMEWTSNVS